MLYRVQVLEVTLQNLLKRLFLGECTTANHDIKKGWSVVSITGDLEAFDMI